MNTKQIMTNLKKYNTGGYFYKDNCRINYSTFTGWYCKDYTESKMNTYNIDKNEAFLKINQSFK